MRKKGEEQGLMMQLAKSLSLNIDGLVMWFDRKIVGGQRAWCSGGQRSTKGVPEDHQNAA